MKILKKALQNRAFYVKICISLLAKKAGYIYEEVKEYE